MRTMLRAFAFLLPLILIGAFASVPLAGGFWLAGGVLMIILAAPGRSWTAWASAPDWPGMTHDALFARINGALSAFWGGIFAVSGLALLLGHTLRHLDTENRQQRATDVGHPAPRSGARAEDAGLCAARAPRQRAAQASNYA